MVFRPTCAEWRDFLHPFLPALGSNPSSYTMCIHLFPGVKRQRRDVKHRLPFSAEVKERVELYVYSTSGPSWPVLG